MTTALTFEMFLAPHQAVVLCLVVAQWGHLQVCIHVDLP